MNTPLDGYELFMQMILRRYRRGIQVSCSDNLCVCMCAKIKREREGVIFHHASTCTPNVMYAVNYKEMSRKSIGGGGGGGGGEMGWDQGKLLQVLHVPLLVSDIDLPYSRKIWQGIKI